jgi:predicted DNA-binding mobile mystery protein A
MSYWDKKLIREQLDKKLIPLKVMAKSGMPETGWIKTIREAFGMSAKDLAKKVGIDQSRISRLENAEKDGNIKLSSLQKIAQGLDMEFVYGFVPKDNLETMVRQQANKIAHEKMKRLSHTMRLELQELSEDEKKSALKDMIDKILIEEPRDFWKK